MPARASIPVTLRKVSSIFTVVSGHSGLDETDIQAVVSTLRAHGTVVLLMGVRTLPDTIEQMMSCGVESDMPLAPLRRGSRTKSALSSRPCSKLLKTAETLNHLLLQSLVRSSIMHATIGISSSVMYMNGCVSNPRLEFSAAQKLAP